MKFNICFIYIINSIHAYAYIIYNIYDLDIKIFITQKSVPCKRALLGESTFWRQGTLFRIGVSEKNNRAVKCYIDLFNNLHFLNALAT